ncbi:PDZ domain-containing protein [Xanthomonas maliensis]|nr:PDZ domain-containing protein [Xanthomonas maliensis]
MSLFLTADIYRPHSVIRSQFRDGCPVFPASLHVGTWWSALWLRRVLLAGLLALLTLQGMRLLWLLLTPLEPLGALPPQGKAVAPALQHDVFFRNGRAVDRDLAASIVLHGVRLGTQPAAYLSRDGQPQGAYRRGDVVGDGVRVHAIAADHVLLRVGAGLQRVGLAAPASAVGGTQVAASPSIPAASAAAIANVAVPASAPAAAAVDPQQLLSTTGLRTSPDGAGLTVVARGDGALLRQAGLMPGDVLTQVNGRALDVAQLPELQDELREGHTATLTYRRDGQTHTLTLKRPQ